MLVRVGSGGGGGAEARDGAVDKALKKAQQIAILDGVAELALWCGRITYYLPIDRFSADHEEGLNR